MTACNKKPKDKPEYHLTTVSDGIVKLDTIKALNDTIAYQEALLIHYSALKAQTLVRGTTTRDHSFDIVDPNGKDLKSKLSKSLIDSLTIEVEEAFSKMQLN
jgi:hypothetical protein